MYTLTYTHNITIADNLLLRPEIRYIMFQTLRRKQAVTHGTNGEFTNDDEIVLAFGAEYVF